MNTLLQVVDHMQTLDMDAYSTPYTWGEEDGLEGKSEFTGYDYFAGHSLTVYLAGHAAGCAMRQRLLSTVLDEVRTVLQPQATRLWGGISDEQTMDEALAAYRSSNPVKPEPVVYEPLSDEPGYSEVREWAY